MWIRIFFTLLLFATDARANTCATGSTDSNTAFLDHIVTVWGNSGTALRSLEEACSAIDQMGENTGAFGRRTPIPTLSHFYGNAQAAIFWSRANLMSREAESAAKQAEMRRRFPSFMSRLDLIKEEQEPWMRIRRTYELVTRISNYDHELHRSITTFGGWEALNTDPVESVARAESNRPIGVCVHFAALLNFALTYVDGGPNVTNFDVSINVGHRHAWNHVSFTTRSGQLVRFDLDPTAFYLFVPLSTSHMDQTRRSTSRRILSACQRMRNCLRSPP